MPKGDGRPALDEEIARLAEELAYYRGVAADPYMSAWARKFAGLRAQAVARLMSKQRRRSWPRG
jgi:hypothetical protein